MYVLQKGTMKGGSNIGRYAPMLNGVLKAAMKGGNLYL
jgi:hypothetical protein